jgi:hypothetical protein
MVLWTAGIVLFSLVVNAPLLGPLMTALHLNKSTPAKRHMHKWATCTRLHLFYVQRDARLAATPGSLQQATKLCSRPSFACPCTLNVVDMGTRSWASTYAHERTPMQAPPYTQTCAHRRARAAVAAYTRQALVDLQQDDDEMLRGVDWTQVGLRSTHSCTCVYVSMRVIATACVPARVSRAVNCQGRCGVVALYHVSLCRQRLALPSGAPQAVWRRTHPKLGSRAAAPPAAAPPPMPAAPLAYGRWPIPRWLLRWTCLRKSRRCSGRRKVGAASIWPSLAQAHLHTHKTRVHAHTHTHM